MSTKTIFLFICFFLSGILLSAQNNDNPNSVKRIANYDITANYNASEKTIDGKMTLHWTNVSSDTIKELQFHLYLNAFKNSSSTFMKESNQQFRSTGFTIDDKAQWGWIDIISIKKGAYNLTSSIKYIHPDDDNAEDRTVISVQLPDSVLPGKSIDIDIDFKSKLPKILARTGFSDNYAFVGQWFPKIGVYESKGQLNAIKGGWNCHQFHANSEFYADFGVYKVDITIPQNYIIGACGLLMKEQKNSNETTTYSYLSEDVIDFAWTTSPRFKVVESKWKDVKILLYIQPEHYNLADRHINSAKIALEYMDENVGAYPYKVLTIVDPPFRGLESGGMEYPTLITTDAFAHMPDGFKMIEMVTIHEFIHQYFMGLLASNEFEEAWMDEGMTTYFETRVMDNAYGSNTSLLDLFGFRMGDIEMQRASYVYARNGSDAEMKKFSWLQSRNSYGVLAYNKPMTFLTTLERILGKETMNEIFKTYFEKWKFKHPCTEDFIAVVEDVLKKRKESVLYFDLKQFFNQMLYRTETCDYEVTSIINGQSLPKAGYYAENDKNEFIYKKSDKSYTSTVKLRRNGELIFPVEVLIHFGNGDERREVWDGKNRTQEFIYESNQKIMWVKLDPDNKLLVDTNLKNNSYTLEANTHPFWKYTVKFLFWVQNILQSVAYFV